jgi:hypothetical protein
MRLTYQNDVIGLSAETPAEEEICALLAAADGHVFRLHAPTRRGLAFREIGPEDEARRAPLNIVRSIEPRFAPISNLAHTPVHAGWRVLCQRGGLLAGIEVARPRCAPQPGPALGP